MISHSKLVESIFGYWPEFADGRIQSFSYEHPGVVSLTIFYIDSQVAKAATVSLRFIGVTELDLSELCSENIVDALNISSERPCLVTIEACYGLGGTFKCISAEVTGVVPDISFEAGSIVAAQLQR
jgi:hypothetical protein